MPEVVAQVSFQEPRVAPGLRGGRPAGLHAKHAKSLRAEPIYPLDEQADRFFRGHDGGGMCG